MYMQYFWLAVIVIGVIVEFIEAGTLVSVWFSVGAIIPCFMGFYQSTNPWYISSQFIVFGVITTICLIFLRKIVKKTLFKNSKETTNLDVWIGKTVKVHTVEETGATIKLSGIVYTAVEENETILNIGDMVEIVKFSGNKAIVNKKDKE